MIVTNTNGRFRLDFIGQTIFGGGASVFPKSRFDWFFFSSKNELNISTIFKTILKKKKKNTFSCICAFLLIALSLLVFSLFPSGDDNILIQIKFAVPYSVFVDHRDTDQCIQLAAARKKMKEEVICFIGCMATDHN